MLRVGQQRFSGRIIAVLALWGASAMTCAQAPGGPAIYLHQGADREQVLLAGAKREGTVSVYTSMQLPDRVKRDSD